MRWVADFCYVLAGLVYLPVALYNAFVRGKNRRGWGQRFGAVPHFDASRRRLWIHAVSLGEVNATPALVEGLRRVRPDLDVVVSTTTDTGFARATALYGADRVFRFPLDFSFAVRRALDRVHPELIVLVELEVWFNLIHEADRRGIPVAVVNGRLTERSARKLARLGGIARSMFRRLTWVGAQDTTIAARFERLGTPLERIEITSSMKWDTATVADRVSGTDELRVALGLGENEALWVCGSTGDDEEPLLLEAFRALLAGATGAAITPTSPRLALVPRKPERFNDVARLIERCGFDVVRRSLCPDGASTPGGGVRTVILGDTLGELRKFYALARVVYVGRSLVPLGGSDPIEAAALGRAVLCGPHMNNFEAPVAALAEAGALRRIGSASELAAAVRDWLADPAALAERGEKARRVVVAHQGATARTVDRLTAILRGRLPS
ncbi:MAG: 3-deoxy-D-manno-octulosonic acid transferase [Phycisphaerae bacterium]|nr:MAG: 3-deoxy-D-manno-octulosonic acid transferase [Planctomycetota bacterium]KAB2944955.1 MAG: 3-deoxy-D-manno-octulosonic acid transferase [Phycisphaerae bacterium]MBE7457711.1 3-deoxy-D-manno-octulosonic acid transferase [Planctomycetia bacterium]MCK6463770.1 3-deoxy-D-manno-octulosonic acid transferase [Phycisphaerae bacterium]MCL4717513.1 3-deoxy-D-manno-octulosonic acid transferase [Phycisphaerae bacterium]